MKISAFVALAMLTWTSSLAQDYAFRVLVNKGQNELKLGRDWVPIKVGASLQSADELRISQNGYLGLVHVTGKPLEVKKPGPHKVVDLAGRVSGGSSVMNKYTDFILSSRTEKGSNLTATGSVYRGTDLIQVFLPKPQFAIIFNDHISISWAKDDKTKKYIVRFNSMFGDELEKLEVQDTTVSIDLNGSKFSNEDNIIVKVSSANDSKRESETFMLKKLSAADKKRINNALSDVAAQTEDETALNQLILASFYEQNALLIDASTAYQNAVKLAPTVPAFQDAYAEFLLRNRMHE